MVAMRWSIALFCGILTLSGTLHAAVSAQLSSQDIDELESVRLTIRATETRQTETLDLSALEDAFHVMGTNTSSQYRFVNGREQSWVDYQITLQPKLTGVLKIPPITVGRDVTPTLELTVRALSSETRDKIKELVFFETEVSSPQVYVQAQIIFTRRLLYSNGVQLYSDLPGAPEIPNAVVLTLGETTAGTAERNGNVYGIVEQRYAIFPEASGRLVLPAIGVTASVRLVEGGRVSRKGVRIGTGETVVSVLPVPAGYPPDQPWLPAEEVIIHQELDDATLLEVGDTATHELLVHVKGNVGSIAPPVEWTPPRDELRTYPQNPIINDDTNSNRVSGSRLQTTSIVPLKPGRLTIPEHVIYWWDTRKNALARSSAPALTIDVTGTAVSAPVEAENPIPQSETTTLEEALSVPDWRSWVSPALWSVAMLLGLYAALRVGRRVYRVSRESRGSPGGISQATTAGELYTGICTHLAKLNQTSLPVAATLFCRQSAEHQDFLTDLQQRAYSSQDLRRDTDRAEIRRALSLVSACGTQRSAPTRESLPPLYNWQ